MEPQSQEQQEFISSQKSLTLKGNFRDPAGDVFISEMGDVVASLQQSKCCCTKLEEQEWIDAEDVPLMHVSVHPFAIIASRHKLTVRFPDSEVAGRVITETSSGVQNNALLDPEDYILAVFEHKRRIFSDSSTTFMTPDGSRRLADMQNNSSDYIVYIQFSDECDFRLRLLIMGAAILYRVRDKMRYRRSLVLGVPLVFMQGT